MKTTELGPPAGFLLGPDGDYRHHQNPSDRWSESRGFHTLNVGGPPERSSWAPVDLRRILAGGAPEIRPTILQRTDGEALLYPGRTHAFNGPPEAGKGLLASQACAECLARGGSVVYIDFEDEASLQVHRMRALGVDPEVLVERFHYLRPEEPLEGRAIADLQEVLALGPALAIIDGVTEAMVLHGLNPDSNHDAARFMERVPRPLAESGAATVSIDHLTKNGENGRRFAIGAQHKLAGISGAAYTFGVVNPFGRGKEGLVTITVAKDRPGYVRGIASGHRVAEMSLVSEDDEIAVVVRAPTGRTPDGSFRPTKLMERVSMALEGRLTEPSQRELLETVTGKRDALLTAVKLLSAEGFIAVRDEGNALRYRSERPYREVDG